MEKPVFLKPMHGHSSHTCLRLLLLLVFSGIFSTGNAQELLFGNLGNEVQLPSQECYKIHQDKAGYIWFSTDNGLCRYGNSQLTVFDARNGLPEESVYTICEDSFGTLWFTTSDNRILYYDGTHLKEAAFNKAYQRFFPSWVHAIPYALDVSEYGKFYISTHFHSITIDTKTKKVKGIELNSPKSAFNFLKKENHSFISFPRNNFLSKQLVTLIKGKVRKQIPFQESQGESYSHPQMLTHLSGNTDFITIHNKLLRVNPDLSHSIYDFPDRILNLYTDKTGGLWVGTLNHGVFYYPDIKTMQLGHHSLRNYSVTGICEDNEAGIWCSTLEKGIFYNKNKHLVSYSSVPGLDRTLSLLKFYNNSLYASSSSKDLFMLNQDIYKKIELIAEKKIGYSDLVYQNNQWFLVGKEILLRTDKHFQSAQQLYRTDYGMLSSYQISSDNNRLISVMYSCIFELFEKKAPEMLICGLPFVSKSILYQTGNSYLLGGNQGIHYFDIGTHQHRKLKGIPDHVTKMLRTRSGRIWVITKNDGIYWIDGKKVTHADKKLSLKTAVLFDITEARDGTIFAGSNQGIYRFKKTGKNYRTVLYNTSNGLSSNEVYKVAADDQFLWFSTFEGLFRFPMNVTIKNTSKPQIHLRNLVVKGVKSSKIKHFLKLDYHQNNLRFTFDILTFKNGTQTKLKYLLSNDKETTETYVDGNEVILENLPPGKYDLKVFGINNDGEASAEPEVFIFEIEAPFWQTWWFILFFSMSIVIIILLIVRFIIRRIRKSEEAKTHINKLIAEYQITALQAQMNPHFIFNAINTIQGYILEKNEEEAYNYLAKFSKLIRTVLHHSQEKVLLLEHEIEVLNLYIELEKLRFDNCFDYELRLSDAIDPHDIHLPGMILQPYVENAIWHGIVNLQESRRGKLIISMDRTDNILLVCIEDNGIGREKARSFNKDKRHKSVGMQLTGERLKAMNRLHGYETAQVAITDLFDENREAAGTKVEVSIPINIEP